MGLYLTIFDNDTELDGVDVGAYSDFERFRLAVVEHVEGGVVGSKCPIFSLHSDCDGEWAHSDAKKLEQELQGIYKVFKGLTPISFSEGWQNSILNENGIEIENLSDCFFDVDGVSLLERLIALAQLSQNKSLPILFQ